MTQILLKVRIVQVYIYTVGVVTSANNLWTYLLKLVYTEVVVFKPWGVAKWYVEIHEPGKLLIWSQNSRILCDEPGSLIFESVLLVLQSKIVQSWIFKQGSGHLWESWI